jgi:hypothetical protein
MAKVLKFKKIVLESDSLVAVSKLNKEEKDFSMYGPLVEGIKDLREFEGYKVAWARRSANGVAHVLAQEGCGLELNKTWFSLYPDCIGVVLVQDLSEV